MRQFAVLAVLVLTACCVGPPQPQPEQTPRVAPPPPPPAPAPPPIAQGNDWRDWPLTPGDWSYARAGAGSVASYGRQGLMPDLTIRCDPARRSVLLSRAAQSPPPTNRVTIRTSTGDTGFAAVRSADSQRIDAELAATDRTLDAMAFSRGRFMVMAPGAANLIVPAWPEMTRVIEDCRP